MTSSSPQHAAEGGEASPLSADMAPARGLLVELRSAPPTDPRRAQLRDSLVDLHMPLARYLATRFRGRGEPLDDLIQVAVIGLLKAIDGFDSERGVDFRSYAIPTMTGELKRHFRDKGWSIRVPRRLTEMRLEVAEATAVLTQQLQRTLTAADLADYLGVTEAEVRESQLAARAYSTASLSTRLDPGDSGSTLADVLGTVDAGMSTVEDRQALRPLIAALPHRQRRIIGMHYYANMTQLEIAKHVGISQMHVSRLLTRSLAQLRDSIHA